MRMRIGNGNGCKKEQQQQQQEEGARQVGMGDSLRVLLYEGDSCRPKDDEPQ